MENHRARLFIASCLALVTTAMIFVIRGNIQQQVMDAYQLTNEAYAFVSTMAFWGFASSILVASPLLDFLGMRNLLYLAFSLHIGGLLVFIFAPNYQALYLSMLFAGFGNGLVEAVINPLCATMYPDQKTHKMNVLHAWWPGGLIIGGLLAVGMSQLNLNWQLKIGIIILPALAYGFLIFGQKFPATERKEAGIPNREMWKEAIRPGFLLLLFCMMITASIELAPGQLVETVLRNTANMSGTMILVYGSALMFVLRFFAGPIAHRISPIGMMWASVTIASIGLFMLSKVDAAWTAYIAATIFYIGVCYMWPTMLGIAAEQFPRGGAVTIGWLGFAGNISVGIVTWIMGSIIDSTEAGASFQFASNLGIIVFLIFGAWWIKDYLRGGYKAIILKKEN